MLELLTLGGRDITHAIKMMVPQAWEKDPDMPPAVKGFFRYHASLMEPWDGPASIVFTDGARIGMTLDRNGLRPARYIHTSDGIVYAGSEIGALDVEPEKIIASGKLGPGHDDLRRPAGPPPVDQRRDSQGAGLAQAVPRGRRRASACGWRKWPTWPWNSRQSTARPC